jgi:lysophospholipase L1-like esterase
MSARARVIHWFIPATSAVLVAMVLGAGFVLALSAKFGEPLAPLPPAAAAAPRTGAFKIVALGDSLTQGTGDVRGGYASRVAEALRRDKRVVIFTNLAVAGAETDDVLGVIRGAEARRQIAVADLLLVSAGGNDLNHGLRGLMTGGAETLPEVSITKARENLRQLVSQLRQLNPNAAIRLLGLYNPFEVAAGESERARALLLDWNVAIEQATNPFPNVVAVPVADLFASRGDLLAGDRFHPGPRGHQLIAQRLLATLPEAAEPAERSDR